MSFFLVVVVRGDTSLHIGRARRPFKGTLRVGTKSFAFDIVLIPLGKINPTTILHRYQLWINIGCLNIHGTHVTANNSTDNNVVFFSDLKIVYCNNY